MNGLMMDKDLSIASIVQHAERVNGDTEIVSVTRDNPRHRDQRAASQKRQSREICEMGFKKLNQLDFHTTSQSISVRINNPAMLKVLSHTRSPDK